MMLHIANAIMLETMFTLWRSSHAHLGDGPQSRMIFIWRLRQLINTC